MSCAIKRILQFDVAIQFSEVKILDENGVDITSSCMYGWSTDGVCWTNWVDYKSYLNIAKNIESDFYLRVLLFGGLSKVYVGGSSTECFNISFDCSNPFLENLCTENTFNPYSNLDCALLLQQQMADSVICMFGLPIYYFQIQPIQETKDYTFKEYILHNVSNVKQIKLMVPDGQLPSSKPGFNDFDFDWELDFECEIGKTEFARAFGDESYPKHEDFIYVPMMKRMWKVNSAYDEKNEGLLWRPTTWKLGLVKYQDNNSVDKGEFEDLIDGFLINKYDEVFANELLEQERETATTQFDSPRNAANALTNVYLQDAVRAGFDTSNITIQPFEINHGSSIVAKNIYNFPNGQGEITYQNKYCGDEGSICFILSTPDAIKTIQNQPIIKINHLEVGISGNTLTFGDAKLTLEKNQTYSIVARWSFGNYTVELNAYKHTTPENIPAYKIRPEMRKFDFENGISSSSIYNQDFTSKRRSLVHLYGGLYGITNFKLFDKYLDLNDLQKETIKYSTKNKHCVLSDLARPITDGLGYSVK